MSFYKHHVFFCTNHRDAARGVLRPSQRRGHARLCEGRVKALGLAGEGKVRINNAGCLDRCEEGPVIVVYPEAVWYTYVDKEDIDEIVEEHLKNGRVVERLRI